MIIQYFLSFFIFLGIDLVWLGVVAKNMYRQELGHLMAKSFSLLPALTFYLLFPIGLVYFCVNPAIANKSAIEAGFRGLLFGAICYATYDLTNLATLKGWTLNITIIDICWGALLSGVTALIVATIAMKLI